MWSYKYYATSIVTSRFLTRFCGVYFISPT